MAIEASDRTMPPAAEDCCDAGIQAYDDYFLAVKVSSDAESAVTQRDVDYRKKRCEVAGKCGGLASGVCLLEREGMLDAFPGMPDNS